MIRRRPGQSMARDDLDYLDNLSLEVAQNRHLWKSQDEAQQWNARVR